VNSHLVVIGRVVLWLHMTFLTRILALLIIGFVVDEALQNALCFDWIAGQCFGDSLHSDTLDIQDFNILVFLLALVLVKPFWL